MRGAHIVAPLHLGFARRVGMLREQSQGMGLHKDYLSTPLVQKTALVYAR